MAEGIVRNRNVFSLMQQIDDFYKEICHSDSVVMYKVSDADMARWNSYLGAIDAYVAYVLDQPEVDVPESSHLAIQIEELTLPPDMDNASVHELAFMIYDMRTAVINNQSRSAYGFHPADAGRVTTLVSKCRKFLADYVDKVQPLDMPESTPEHEPPPAGRKGQ